MTELMLLRHGKSDWAKGLPDFDRPLSDRGKRDAQRVGNYLRVHSLLPDRVISSPACRARETAEKCVKAAGMTAAIIEYDDRIYEASAETLSSVTEELRDTAGRILLVGHNPGFDELAIALFGDDLERTDSGKLMTTASLLRLDLGGNREGITGRFIALLRPGDLPRKFLFRSPAGDEFRDRPQYYYSQSAVIPYRESAQGIEILMIAKRGSKNARKWSVPKGIVEPGMSPPASAAKEAMEEGGVSGEVARAMLGAFSIEKWGSVCEVSVFPMRVTDVADPARWESAKRQRRWFDLASAAAVARYPALGELIGQLPDTIGSDA